jgi:hypothetical protein
MPMRRAKDMRTPPRLLHQKLGRTQIRVPKSTGEIVCDLIHPHTRILKEPEDDKEYELEAHPEV